MFTFGNFTVKSGSFGNRPILSMWFGNKQFYPDGTTQSIVLESTSATVGESGTNAYINLTASSASWTVVSDASWITVAKDSNNRARYWVDANTSGQRTGTISFKIDGVSYATFTITQESVTYYITLTPKLVNLTDGLATGGTISVSSNTTEWTVSTSSAGFTAEKYYVGGKYNVRWTVTENTTGEQRIGYIKVSYGSVTAQTQINQSYETYVLSGLSSNPMTIGSGQTSFIISLISKFGQAITEQPSVSIGYMPTMNVQMDWAATGGAQGQWNFRFTCNANDTTSQRTVSIVFTQPGSNKTLTYVIHQSKKQSAPSIDGITVKAYYNNWVLGTVTNGQTTVPVGTVDIDGIVIAIAEQITTDHTATVSMVYQNGPLTSAGTPTTYTKTDQEVSIPAGSTITASGNTYNGVWVQTPLPRLSVNQVTKFIVN